MPTRTPGRRRADVPDDAPVEHPWRRRIQTFLGTVMLVAGLVLLGWFLWQYFGTNIVAKQEQAQIREATRANWDDGIEGDAIGLLRVPRFGDDYEVPIVKGIDKPALARGVGWYPKGAGPGEIGNFVLAGHRVTHGEPFRDFLKLKKGDEVFVETRTHVYTYVLRQDGTDIRVDFTVGWPLAPIPDPDARGQQPTEALLTLITCSELFHTRDRNVVIGDLVEILDKKTGQSQPLP